MASSIPTGGTIFSFTPIVPQEGKKDPIWFRATLDTLTDIHSANWSAQQDMGRADQKFMYDAVDRNMTIGFKVVCPTRDEYETQWNAVNSLAELTHPHYYPGRGYNGVFVQIKVGKLIDFYGMLGNIDIDVDTDYPWMTPEGGGMPERPMLIDVTVQATWIGKKKPEYRKWALYNGDFGTGIEYPQ